MEQVKVLSSWSFQGKEYQTMVRKTFFFNNDVLEEKVEIILKEKKSVLFLKFWKEIERKSLDETQISLEGSNKEQDNHVVKDWLVQYGKHP